MDAFSLNQDEIHAFRQIPCRQFEGLPSGRQSPFSQIQHAAACIVQHADAEMPCLVQVQFEECRVRDRIGVKHDGETLGGSFIGGGVRRAGVRVVGQVVRNHDDHAFRICALVTDDAVAFRVVELEVSFPLAAGCIQVGHLQAELLASFNQGQGVDSRTAQGVVRPAISQSIAGQAGQAPENPVVPVVAGKVLVQGQKSFIGGNVDVVFDKAQLQGVCSGEIVRAVDFCQVEPAGPAPVGPEFYRFAGDFRHIACLQGGIERNGHFGPAFRMVEVEVYARYGFFGYPDSYLG